MKKQEAQKLKEILRPLIKECIREAIFEEGVLSALVAEVASGLNGSPIVENTPQRDNRNEIRERRKINETKKKMRDAIGSQSYGSVDIFEGTEPLSSGGGGTPSHSPLANIDPRDKGVNIDSLVGLFGDKWSALK